MKSTLRLAAFLALGEMAMNVGAMATAPKMPTFFARRDYPGLYNLFVQVADTNGDGIPDLIAGSGPGAIKVQFGNGDGTFRAGPETVTSANRAWSFVPADLDGDGKIDLVQSNMSSVVVCTGNGNGTFQSSVSYPINDGHILYSVVGDFNGDHIPDIAAAGNSGVWLLTGKGDGTFNAAVLAVQLAGSENIVAADFNEDGKLDLVVTLPNGGTGFAVLLGNGNGTFQTPQRFSGPGYTNAVAVGSLTKGGPPSIALNGNGAYAYVYFGNGKGGFSGPGG